MTQYQLTLDRDSLQRLFGGNEQMAHLLEQVLNQVLEAQVSEHLHADPYERSEERQGYRNGYKPRQLTTRVGTLALRVPQVRDGSFTPELFARYQRSEQALVCTLMGRPWRWSSTASRRAKSRRSPRNRGVVRQGVLQVHCLGPLSRA
jgi:putative transposase